MAARPASASRGNVASRSHCAACGMSRSFAKRRTACRISSAGADIGERVVAEEVALLAVAFGHAVDAPATHLQDARRAVDMLAFGRGEECGVQLRGEGIAFDADARFDREPHRAVGRRHQRRAVDDSARTFETGFVGKFERASRIVCAHDPESVGPQETGTVEHLLELLLPTSSIPIAVASPPPMQRLATPRFRPRLRSAPISVTRMRAPEAPIGWPSAQAPPCTFTFSCGRPCSFIAAIATTAKASLISKRSTSLAFQPVRSKSF